MLLRSSQQKTEEALQFNKIRDQSHQLFLDKTKPIGENPQIAQTIIDNLLFIPNAYRQHSDDMILSECYNIISVFYWKLYQGNLVLKENAKSPQSYLDKAQEKQEKAIFHYKRSFDITSKEQYIHLVNLYDDFAYMLSQQPETGHHANKARQTYQEILDILNRRFRDPW